MACCPSHGAAVNAMNWAFGAWEHGALDVWMGGGGLESR